MATGRRIISIVVFALLVFALPARAGTNPPQAAPSFFSSIQDVPLMNGLEELTDQTVSFDKPEGRIIESVARIQFQSVSAEDVTKFYKTTLPQLGWSPLSENSFEREGEHLRMNFEDFEGDRFLRVMVTPR